MPRAGLLSGSDEKQKTMKKQCFWMPRDARTGAGMPELRGGEIKQLILLSK